VRFSLTHIPAHQKPSVFLLGGLERRIFRTLNAMPEVLTKYLKKCKNKYNKLKGENI